MINDVLTGGCSHCDSCLNVGTGVGSLNVYTVIAGPALILQLELHIIVWYDGMEF